MTLWSRGIKRSRDKLKTLYLNYQSDNGHQTWWLILRSSYSQSYLIPWLRGFARLRDLVKPLYFNYVVSMTTKLGRMVTYLEEFLTKKSRDLLITCSYKFMWQTKTTTTVPMVIKFGRIVTWSCMATWQTETIISPLPQCSWSANLIGWWLIVRSSHP